MGVNGVSHHIVSDDLEGTHAILQWLGTMPPVVGAPPPSLGSLDPIDRPISYAPQPGQHACCKLLTVHLRQGYMHAYTACDHLICSGLAP